MKIRLLFITIAFLLVNTFCVAQDADIKKMKEKEMYNEYCKLINNIHDIIEANNKLQESINILERNLSNEDKTLTPKQKESKVTDSPKSERPKANKKKTQIKKDDNDTKKDSSESNKKKPKQDKEYQGKLDEPITDEK